MKIAIIGSAIHSAPYREGVIHAPLQLAYFLADNLREIGNEVTFFGQVNSEYQDKSKLAIDNLSYNPSVYQDSKGYRKDFFVAYEQGFIMNVIKKCQQNNFDVIYYYVPYRIGPLAGLTSIPVIATHHDSTHMDEYNKMYQSFSSDNLYVIPISNSLKDKLKYNNYLATIYNGVDPSLIPENESDNYFIWVGRIVESKGLHIVIDLAEKLKFHLKVIGPLGPFADFPNSADYSNKMRVQMNAFPNIDYLGVVDQLNTYKYISKAKALIFPSDGTEACPLVPIESAVAGVPVITSKKGPMPEIIDENITGILCSGISEYESAISNIERLSRKKCREHAILRFSFDKVSKEYEKEFLRVINNHRTK